MAGVIDQVECMSEDKQDPSRFDNVRSDLELMSIQDMKGEIETC